MKKWNRKEIFSLVSLALILLAGLMAAGSLMLHEPTFDGSKVDAYALMQEPEKYTEEADGAAAVIVKENLAKTISPNAVFSVVFNFRGYDTMGESFVLYTAVCGTAVVLRHVLKKKEKKGEEANA